MQIQHLEHRHGGRITNIEAIAHDTWQRQSSWHFIGSVEWSDGSKSAISEISPVCICYDHDNPAAKQECDSVMASLTDYLNRNGKWSDGNGWKPKAKKGREALS